MKRSAMSIMLLACILMVQTCLADRGAIPLEDTWIIEARQLAIVAWNGSEEVLILTTRLSSGLKEVKVLELLPLPSKPVVDAVGREVFEVLVKLMKTRKGVLVERGVEEVFHRVLGPHDLWVLRVESGADVVSWIKSYASKQGLKVPAWLSNVEATIQGYVDRGYRYLAVDVVTLAGEGDVKPLMYRFSSKYAYYPLEVSKLAKGETFIVVAFLTPRRLGIAEALKQGFAPLYVGEVDVEKLGVEELVDVVGRRAYLELLIYAGDVDGLSGDLELDFLEGQWEPYTPPLGWVKVDVKVVDAEARIEVKITFPSSGFKVDWGRLRRERSRLQVDVHVERWTGVTMPVVTYERHTYVAKGLKPGTYLFTLMVNGKPLTYSTVKVSGEDEAIRSLTASSIWALIGLAVLALSTAAELGRSKKPSVH